MITYVGPDQGDGSPSLVVTRDELESSIDVGQYAAMQDGAVRAGFEGVELLEDTETTVAGHPAVMLTYRWQHDEGAMRQRLWCVVDGGVGYVIVASAPDDAWDGLRSTFAAALQDFSPA